MAEFYEYHCKQCGHKEIAPEGGFAIKRATTSFYFKCKACKEIISYSTEEIAEKQLSLICCPKCRALHSLITWNPVEGRCPKCGGEMEKPPLAFPIFVD